MPTLALICVLLFLLLLLTPDKKEVQAQPIYQITEADAQGITEITLQPDQLVSDDELIELYEVTGNEIYYEMVFGCPPSSPEQMPTPTR